MRVPTNALLGEEGKGFYYIMSTFQNERLVVGAMSAGQCGKSIELTVDDAPASSLRLIAMGSAGGTQQGRVAGGEVGGSSLAGLRLRTDDRRGKNTVREVSMLKACACGTLQEVVHGCLQLHGGTGFIIGAPIECMARDARILTIGGGATEVMLEEVAKRMQCGDCCGLGKPSLPIFPQQSLMCDGAKASTSAPSMVSRSASI